MPSFTVSHQSRLSAEEAFERVCSVVENASEFRDIDPQYRCSFDDQNLSGSAKSKLFKAALKVKQRGSGSQVDMTIDLPMKYALAKGMIRNALKQKMRAEL
ncbi:MAG: hypothetical protein AAF542_25195 [Pseudomonadota bacterium]